MRLRRTSVIPALLLALAACAGPAGSDGTTTTTTTAMPTTTTIDPATIPVVLTYSLEPGTTFTYEIDFEITVDMLVTGDASMLSDGDEFPGDLDIVMTGTTTVDYSIDEGPEPGTHQITITGEFGDVEVSGVADGEPVDTGEVPEFAEMEPVQVTVVVDEKGNVVGGDDEMGNLLGGGFGDFLVPGADIGRFVGPPLPDQEVEVGSTWSKTIDTPMFLGDPVTTRIDSEVTSIDADGVVEIRSTLVTSEVLFDMGVFLTEMIEAFLPEDATEEELAALEALKEQLKFLLSIDETTNRMTSWFDPSLGLATESALVGDTRIVMDVNMPDETTGELIVFVLDMGTSEDITYRLVRDTG